MSFALVIAGIIVFSLTIGALAGRSEEKRIQNWERRVRK